MIVKACCAMFSVDYQADLHPLAINYRRCRCYHCHRSYLRQIMTTVLLVTDTVSNRVTLPPPLPIGGVTPELHNYY